MNKYLDLIDEKKICERLKKANYIPSLFECAYIVYDSKKLTLNDKHSLWEEIIDITTDEILENDFKVGVLTLHEFLNRYIELQKVLYDQFFKKEENAVYTCSSEVLIDSSGYPLIDNPFYFCNVYTDLDLCIKDAFQKCKKPCNIRKHYIKTSYDDADYKSIWVDYSENGEVMDVRGIFCLNDDESEIFDYFIEKKNLLHCLFEK